MTSVPPATARADEPSAADKETARSLLIDGRAKRDAKDYAGALVSLKAAHAIMHVPTTGLDYAQVLALTGQLVEARTTALDVTRIPPKDGEGDAFREARTKAAALATELEARIPAVRITVTGLPPDREPTVTLDGANVPAAALGLPRKVNPGRHVLVVSATGFGSSERKLTLQEGGAPVAVSVAMTAEAKAPDVVVAPPVRESHIPAWAWIAGGVGVVGLGVGIGFAADYSKVKSTVSSDCPNNACFASTFAAANALESRWNRDVGLMSAGLVVGVAGIAVAAVGFVRESRKQAPSSALIPSVAPWFTPGAGGLAARGAF